jgi:CRP/FNR family transcriptional regulator, cyclic AMP receptor protein
MMRLLVTRQRAYRTRVEELLYKSAHARVAHTLLDLAGQHGIQDAEGVVIPLRLSQRDIANLVGLTRETVNFILKDLRERNLIETEGRSIRVRSPEVVQAVRWS